MDKKIAFIGAGKMATAIIKGLLESNLFNQEKVFASEPNLETAKNLSKELGIQFFQDNKQSVKEADIILLAVKPFVVKNVLEEIKDEINDSKLIISIAAGISSQKIEEYIGKTGSHLPANQL